MTPPKSKFTAQPPPTWSINLPMEPMGKQRPRFGKGRTYTPAETQKWTREASRLMSRAFPFAAYSGVPLHVEIVAYFPRLKRKPPYVPSAAWKAVSAFWKITKPDVDNIAKIVLDAMTAAGVISDDNIIASQLTTKRICSACEDDAPRVEITVRVMGWEEAK